MGDRELNGKGEEDQGTVAIDQAMAIVGGVEGWRRRIAERARREGAGGREEAWRGRG